MKKGGVEGSTYNHRKRKVYFSKGVHTMHDKGVPENRCRTTDIKALTIKIKGSNLTSAFCTDVCLSGELETRVLLNCSSKTQL